MRAYQDKETGLWKWGTRGEPKYKSKDEAKRTEMELLEKRLRQLKKRMEDIYGTIGT